MEFQKTALLKNIVAKNTIPTWIKDKEKFFAAYESGKVNPKPKSKILTKQSLHGSKTPVKILYFDVVLAGRVV